MTKHLRKRLDKLKQRQRAYEALSKKGKGTSGYKAPGSMNVHKQHSNKLGR